MRRGIDQNSFPESQLAPIICTKRNIAKEQPKALIFDLMGTCCDWHSSIVPAIASCPTAPSLSSEDYSNLAIDWREGFFEEIHHRFQTGEPAEDIDVTHRRVLDRLLQERGVDSQTWDDEVRDKLVQQWHNQIGI